MDRHTVSRQISMSMVGNSKFGEKVVKGPLIFANCQKILLKLLQPELLFRGWLSHERALHTRSINGMSHTEAVERKQFSAAFNRVCFASMFYIYPFYCMLWNQKFVPGGGFSSDLPKGFEYIHTNILNFVTFHYKTHTFLN